VTFANIWKVAVGSKVRMASWESQRAMSLMTKNHRFLDFTHDCPGGISWWLFTGISPEIMRGLMQVQSTQKKGALVPGDFADWN